MRTNSTGESRRFDSTEITLARLWGGKMSSVSSSSLTRPPTHIRDVDRQAPTGRLLGQTAAGQHEMELRWESPVPASGEVALRGRGRRVAGGGQGSQAERHAATAQRYAGPNIGGEERRAGGPDGEQLRASGGESREDGATASPVAPCYPALAGRTGSTRTAQALYSGV